MIDKLNWGILSTARITRRVIPPIHQAERSQAIAVASRNQASAQAFAQKWDIPHAFGSYDELLESPDIDAVYIPLPNSLHCEWVIKAAQARKHILCEKPLALTVDDVDRMREAAETNNVVLLEAFMYRMHPQLATLKSLINNGLIGEVQLVRAKFSFTLTDPTNIRLQKALGGGSLWDVGCYPVSFAQAIADSDPEEAFGWQKRNEQGAETMFVGQLNYANGLIAQFDSSFALPFRSGAEVIGETGTIYVPVPWIPDVDGKHGGLIHIAADDTETRIETEEKDPYLCEVEAVEKAALDGIAPLYTLKHSRGNVATINALYQSAELGLPVKL